MTAYTYDLFLVVGIVLLVFTVPAIVSAISDRRPPRLPALVLMIGGVLVAVALAQKPGGYAIDDIPAAFSRVINRFL